MRGKNASASRERTLHTTNVSYTHTLNGARYRTNDGRVVRKSRAYPRRASTREQSPGFSALGRHFGDTAYTIAMRSVRKRNHSGECTYDRRIFDPSSRRTALSSRLAGPLKFPPDSVYRVLLRHTDDEWRRKPTKSSESRGIATQ